MDIISGVSSIVCLCGSVVGAAGVEFPAGEIFRDVGFENVYHVFVNLSITENFIILQSRIIGLPLV